jgi:hypothetical protein
MNVQDKTDSLFKHCVLKTHAGVKLKQHTFSSWTPSKVVAYTQMAAALTCDKSFLFPKDIRNIVWISFRVLTLCGEKFLSLEGTQYNPDPSVA